MRRREGTGNTAGLSSLRTATGCRLLKQQYLNCVQCSVSSRVGTNSVGLQLGRVGRCWEPRVSGIVAWQGFEKTARSTNPHLPLTPSLSATSLWLLSTPRDGGPTNWSSPHLEILTNAHLYTEGCLREGEHSEQGRGRVLQ